MLERAIARRCFGLAAPKTGEGVERSRTAVNPGHPPHVAITGASSGIGTALAKAYALRGARLTLFGRDHGRLADVESVCRSLGARAKCHAIDVTDQTEMERCLLAADDAYPLDIVIANAGVGGESAVASAEGELTAVAATIFRTNVLGVVHTVAPLVARFAARAGGHIVIISSLAGLVGLPDAPSYSASKAAVRTYGHGLRRLLAHRGVKVSLIYPGFVATPMSANLGFRPPLVWSADRAAERIILALAQGKREVTFPFLLGLAARVGAFLPTELADFILARRGRTRLGPYPRA
jgi:short-subunit dehydrogenase